MTLKVLIWIHWIILAIVGLKAAGNLLYAVRQWDIDRGVSQDRLSLVATQLVLIAVVFVFGRVLIGERKSNGSDGREHQGA